MDIIAVVSGASTGIGRQVAIMLSRKGYLLVLVARRKDKLEETKKLLGPTGKAEVFPANLADLEAIKTLTYHLKNKYKHIDVIANIAGIWHDEHEAFASKPYDTITSKMIIDTVTVGTLAPMLLIHELIPAMTQGGCIINLSGTFESDAKGWVPYYVSKRAIEDLTVALAQDLHDKGIRVICISPSDTATEEYKKFFPEDAATAQSPQEVAHVLVNMIEKGKSGTIYVLKKGKVRKAFHT